MTIYDHKDSFFNLLVLSYKNNIPLPEYSYISEFYDFIVSHNEESLKRLCMSFNIRDWYNFFEFYEEKNKKEAPYLYSIHYPPEHFWGYLKVLISMIQDLSSLDEKTKKKVILNWRNQILELLDTNYLNQGYLNFPRVNSLDDSKIACPFSEINEFWIDAISPFLNPYNRDSKINKFLKRLNKLGIHNHRLIERMVYKVEVFNTKRCEIIRCGGFALGDTLNFSLGLYSLKLETSISLEYLKEYGWLDSLVDKDDDFLKKTMNAWAANNNILEEVSPEFRKKYENIY